MENLLKQSEFTQNYSIDTASVWNEYELIDSGDGRKLERFGPYTVIRPESQAIWMPTVKEQWQHADSEYFSPSNQDTGHWKQKDGVMGAFTMHFDTVTFQARFTPFRHLGVFPEQTGQWIWMKNLIKSQSSRQNILNLFAYTGIASILLSQLGANVTHVDASKKSIEWAKVNQELSGAASCPIRWIVDDAMKFVRREIRRGNRYDAVILDPPKFGRGPQGEIFKLEESLYPLIREIKNILRPDPLFFLLTTYATQLSAVSLRNITSEVFNEVSRHMQFGELVTKQIHGQISLSHAIYARFCRL